MDGKSSWKVKTERSGPGSKVKSREGVGRKRTRISRDMNENIWEAGNYILVRLSVGGKLELINSQGTPFIIPR